MPKFTIGADPELFVVNDAGKFISAVGHFGGTKHSPMPIGNGCSIQEDNVAVEFNIPPCHSIEELKTSLGYALSIIGQQASSIGLSLSGGVASYVFDDDQLDTPQARLFGCEPDYNAWLKAVNPRPNATDVNLRSCGGHIHVGTDLDKVEVVRFMDLFLGVPSTVMDSDTRRRELYGKAGCFRPKEYGVEYRTLSNFWIWNERTIEWAYNQTARALELVADGAIVSDEFGDMVQSVINEGNKDVISKLDQRFGLQYA